MKLSDTSKKSETQKGNFLNLTGEKVGHLKVIRREPNDGIYTVWLCRCICGTLKNIRATYLRNGTAKSCGCRKINRKRIPTVKLSPPSKVESTLAKQLQSLDRELAKKSLLIEVRKNKKEYNTKLLSMVDSLRTSIGEIDKHIRQNNWRMQ